MKSIERYPNLLKPIRLGDTIFRNRIFSAPTGLYDLTPERAPTADFIAYFERKARGGAASVNIGECYTDDYSHPNGGYEVIHLNERKYNYTALGKLADSISRYGAVPTIELQKPGMATMPDGTEVLLSADEGFCRFRPELPCKCLTEDEILEIIDAYASAAVYAKNRGFGMVMVHAGHGWLLHQFFSPYTNHRTDSWGGSTENRARFAVAVIDEIHKRCGKGFPVEIRISGSEAFEGGYDISYGVEIAKQLEGHADLIHVSVGNLFAEESMHYTHPGIFQEGGMNVKYAAEIKKHIKTPVATIGGLSDPDQLEEIIASGKADVVEMARGLICEPDLAVKLRTGREKEVRKCLRCFNCVGADYVHGRLFCAINPSSGKEREISAANPPKFRRKVLVAGGGISGMEAAVSASERGHEVVLCEKTDQLGGILLCERDVPFKKRVGEYIEHQKYMLDKLGVEVHLNTPVTPEVVDRIAPDALIVAVGAEPYVPTIPGIEAENVFTAARIFEAPETARGKTVILGAGRTGIELAIYLRGLGTDVEIVEMAEEDPMISGQYRSKINEYCLKVRYRTKAVEISSDGVRCSSPDGEVEIPADTVVLALGMKPLWDAAEALSGFAGEFYQIGDCRQSRNIFAATGEAWTVAQNIGMF